MITIEQIKNKLSEAVKQSGKTQREIAEHIGIKQQTVSHYLTGERMPALDIFANLCAVLDLDANEILCIK